MKSDPNHFLPLSPASLNILLALASEDRHGYGIMLEVARQSEGQCKLGPGTLYDNLQKLTTQKLVTEVEGAAGEDSRRRYYRLTGAGRGVLAAEIRRLEGVIRTAKPFLRTLKPRSAS